MRGRGRPSTQEGMSHLKGERPCGTGRAEISACGTRRGRRVDTPCPLHCPAQRLGRWACSARPSLGVWASGTTLGVISLSGTRTPKFNEDLPEPTTLSAVMGFEKTVCSHILTTTTSDPPSTPLLASGKAGFHQSDAVKEEGPHLFRLCGPTSTQ